jgi:hypothetical protein
MLFTLYPVSFCLSSLHYGVPSITHRFLSHPEMDGRTGAQKRVSQHASMEAPTWPWPLSPAETARQKNARRSADLKARLRTLRPPPHRWTCRSSRAHGPGLSWKQVPGIPSFDQPHQNNPPTTHPPHQHHHYHDPRRASTSIATTYSLPQHRLSTRINTQHGWRRKRYAR